MSKQASPKGKVLQVIQPTDGGSALHVKQVLAGIDTSMFEVHLAASPTGDYAAVCEQTATVFHPIAFSRSLSLVKGLVTITGLRKLMRQENYDVIHLHSTTAGLLGRLAAVGLKARVVYTPHSFLYLQPQSPVKRQMFYWLEKLSLFLVNVVIFVSVSEQKRAYDDKLMAAGKGVVIVNGIVLPSYDRKVSKHPVITMVSRLEHQKRQQDLIKAAPLVLRYFPNAEFRIIGDGSRRAELQLLIDSLNMQKYAKLMGARNDITAQFFGSDVAVQCSETEGLPYTVLEAMSCACPVVGTNVEGIVDLVIDGQTGTLYPLDDNVRLAERIVYLLQNPKEAQSMGKNGRELVKQKYSVTSMIKSLSDLYRAGM